MAKLVTLHDADGEIIYPQSVWDENMIPDNTIKSSMIDWSTINTATYHKTDTTDSQTLSTSWQTINALGSFTFVPTTTKIAVFVQSHFWADATQSGVIEIGFRIGSSGSNVRVDGNDWYPGNCVKTVGGIGFATVTPGEEITIYPVIKGANNFVLRLYEFSSISVWSI